jgi:pilus assembly protein CpaB
VWALIVTMLFTRITRGAREARSAGPERTVVVAARGLPLGAVITRDAVKLRNVPERLVPSGSFTRVEDALDRPVTSNIEADEPLLEARVAPRGSGVGLAPLIPPGMRAISVRVNDVVGVAGFVLPGMRVDVLVTGQPVNHVETVTRTALQNILVLSAGQTIQTDGKSAISTPVVTLLVTPEDAEALTLANHEGHIQLVLRNSSDAAVATTRGRLWNELYGAPRPPAAEAAAPEAPRRERTAARPVSPPPVVKPEPPPPAQKEPEAVTMIRGSVKTVEVAGRVSK